MAKLPDNWVSGYDGQRWYFQYAPTGMVQYHFPQEGDEYAEFLLDVGTGPIKLTPEDSLAIEQESKRRSIPGLDDNDDDDTRSGPKTNGIKREKRENAGIEEGYSMSATGYFDSSAYFPDAYSTVSPLVDDDPEGAVSGERTSKAVRNMASNVAVELPESSRQVWSPVGFVAELATQDTVKCAEELAPVEMDATSYTPAPIQTNVAQGPSELPTHRTPAENNTLVSKPTQPIMQPVDSYPLVHASFTYPPLQSDMNSSNNVSHDIISMGKQPADAGQNRFQPWKPTQDGTQQHQQPNKALEALPQTSAPQNQDSELGSLGRKNSQNAESSISGDVAHTLVPPSKLGKSVETSSTIDIETSSIPAVLQPGHRPGEESISLGTTNSQVIPGNHARHDSISIPAATHTLSYTPSALKPGGSKPNNSLQESEDNRAQGSTLPYRHSEQAIQASSVPNDHPSVMRVNTLPGHSPSTNSKMNGSPGFLFFHEIPSKSDPLNHGTTVYQESSFKPATTPQTSGSGRMDSQPRINVDEQIPVVAPLDFVKRHSSKSSQVSSITPETPSSKPALAGSDEISDVISVISSFTPQGTPAPGSQPSQQSSHTAIGNNSKPSPMTMSEGVGAPTDVATGGRPQPLNQQFPSPAMTMQQSNIAPPLHGQINMIMSPSNAGITTTQSRPNVQAAHHPSPSFQGSSSQNHRPSMSLSSQAIISGKVSMPPGPLKPQGNASTPFLPNTSAAIAPGRPTPQTSNITHANLAQLGPQSNSTHHTNDAVQQANVPTSHAHGPTQISVTTSAQQALHHPLGQNIARPHSIAGPPPFQHPQSGIQKPQLQHPVMVGPSSQQSVQPPITHQSVGLNTAHVLSQQPYQHSSPVTQSVSPIQSQVSSPAQSVASLHVSQASTPASTSAAMNSHTGPNVNSNQTNAAQIRPSSVPAHALSHQVGNATSPVGFNPKPPTPAGIPHDQLSQTPNPSATPYPMLPGQVTPLPSQIGSAPFPPPVQQSMPNNHAKPTVNIPQPAVGQQLAQTASGGPVQHYVVPGQVIPMLTSPQGNVVYGQASSQAQIKPPQQQAPSPHAGATHTGGYHPPANQSQPQHMVSYPSSIVTSQPNNSHMTLPHSPGILPTAGQHTFPPPPPMAQAQQLPHSPAVASPLASTQGKPFTSAQAATALTDAGKGVKKWARKVWKNPAIKQTAVGIGGAVMAESIGVNGSAGAHLANSIFANVTRPPQTAPPQAHGIQSAVPQHQSVQMGQQYLSGKPQPLHPQPSHHPGHPQPGHPQPGHPQPGHPQPGHPRPSQVQSGHQQAGHPQLINHPAGAQMHSRPPVVQNPPLATGLAINFNAQAQAQIGLNQQQQNPVRPAMVNIPPPPPPPPAVINIGVPGTQAQAQTNVDATNLATAAVIVGSAVGAAFHHENSQPQHGHTQSDHMLHSESYGGGNHGYATEHHHEQAYGSSVSATHTDNNYVAADMTYIDNSNYSVNNTYIDNTEVVNNTVYIDNSTAVVADTNYDNTGYADTATYSGTEITTNVSVDVDINSAVFTDSSVTAFSMDESINIASNSEFAVSSADYSGDGYGDLEF